VLNNHGGAITSVACRPHGPGIAAADIGGTVLLWDARARDQLGKPLKTHHLVSSVAFSPDGRTLATGNGDNGTVALWDVKSHRLIRTLGIGNRGPVNSVAFGPDGRTLAIGSESGTVQLWLPSASQLVTLNAASGPVFSVAFSPDGHTLAAGGFNGTTRVWEGIP
jgi:WD40 repeat protein